VRSIRIFGLKGFVSGVLALALALGGMAASVAAPVAVKNAVVSKNTKANKSVKSGKAAAKPARAQRAGKRPLRKVAVRAEPARPSFGQLSGLRATEDELALKSSVALVVDQDTDEVLFSKNSHAVLPIASITKLMTALVVTEAQLPLDENLTVTQDDVAATAGSRSRLKLGTQLTRGEMLHLALMASENRAAHLLGRTYPGGWTSLWVP
jgi:D-alanyl-D-alanine endopeptidase (penicillin-binding protein 7)